MNKTYEQGYEDGFDDGFKVGLGAELKVANSEKCYDTSHKKPSERIFEIKSENNEEHYRKAKEHGYRGPRAIYGEIEDAIIQYLDETR